MLVETSGDYSQTESELPLLQRPAGGDIPSFYFAFKAISTNNVFSAVLCSSRLTDESGVVFLQPTAVWSCQPVQTHTVT